MLCSKPKMYAPKSSSWFVHETITYLHTSFGSVSTVIWTDSIAISHFSDIVTVQPVSFSCSNVNNFSLVRVATPGSSIFTFEVNLKRRNKTETFWLAQSIQIS